MTQSPENDTPTLQREVQRLLGRCLLRLQQYERLMKSIAATCDITIRLDEAAKPLTETWKDPVSRKTLGQLVDSLLGSFIVAGPPEKEEDMRDAKIASSVRVRFRIEVADFVRVESGLKELVGLRNNLVHHFIHQHDINSLDGCRGASTALITAYERIDHHLEELREWAGDFLRMRESMAETMAPGTPFYMALVHGIHPDGTINWQIASIVEALRKAATDLQVDGWAPVAEAGAWVAAHEPELSPQAYGCRSWPQVLHESRAFELRHLEKDGQRAAWYRAKTVSSKAH